MPTPDLPTEDPTASDVPRRLVNTRELIGSTALGTPGAVWKLEEPIRDLDSNVVSLPAGDGIQAHQGPALDVLIHVLEGTGTLGTENGDLPLRAGDLLWMPRHTLRSFTAGADGLIYHTVHQKKPGLQLQRQRPSAEH